MAPMRVTIMNYLKLFLLMLVFDSSKIQCMEQNEKNIDAVENINVAQLSINPNSYAGSYSNDIMHTISTNNPFPSNLHQSCLESIPEDIIGKFFEYVGEIFGYTSTINKLKKENLNESYKIFKLTKVCPQWRKIFWKTFPDACLIYRLAWTISVSERLNFTNEFTQDVYGNYWCWEGTWPSFEKGYSSASPITKLDLKHLRKLVVQSNFKPSNQKSFSFLKELIPQLQLEELQFNLDRNEPGFLQELFDISNPLNEIFNLVLKDTPFDLNSTEPSFSLTGIPCEKLTLIDFFALADRGFSDNYDYHSLIKRLNSWPNLKIIEIKKQTSITSADAALILNLLINKKDLKPHIILSPNLYMAVGRQVLSLKNLEIAEFCFKMAIEGG